MKNKKVFNYLVLGFLVSILGVFFVGSKSVMAAGGTWECVYYVNKDDSNEKTDTLCGYIENDKVTRFKSVEPGSATNYILTINNDKVTAQNGLDTTGPAVSNGKTWSATLEALETVKPSNFEKKTASSVADELNANGGKSEKDTDEEDDKSGGTKKTSGSTDKNNDKDEDEDEDEEGVDTGIVETNLFGTVVDNGDGKGCGVYLVLNLVLTVLTWGVGIAATIGLVISAIMYLTARDNESQVSKAKTRILEIVVGLVLYAMLWASLNWLIPGGSFNTGTPCSSQTTSSVETEEIWTV